MITAALLALAAFLAQAPPVCRAASWAQVQTCHDSSPDGTTITVAAGTYTVSAPTTLTKFVQVVADGPVTLTNHVPTTLDFLSVTESPAGSTRIEGFTIQGNAHRGDAGMNATIQLRHRDGGQPIVIVGNTFTDVTGNVIYASTRGGVIARNTFRGVVSGPGCLNNASLVRHKPQWDTASWKTPATFGRDDTGGAHLYIEDNTAVDVLEGIDVDDNARTVLRFNTLTNTSIITHGDTSFPGGRYFEAVGNTWVRDLSLKPQCEGGTLWTNWNGLATWRAGSGFLIANVIPDVKDGAWGDKSEVTFRVDALQRRSGGPFACWKQGGPFPAQTGWGYTTGSTPAGNSGYKYDRQPIYLAANTGGGNYDRPWVADYGVNECGEPLQFATSYVQAGREFFPQSATTQGTRAGRPLSAPNDVGYWSLDRGGNWNSANTATEDGCLDIVVDGAWRDCAYTPATYPHALARASRPSPAPGCLYNAITHPIGATLVEEFIGGRGPLNLWLAERTASGWAVDPRRRSGNQWDVVLTCGR